MILYQTNKDASDLKVTLHLVVGGDGLLEHVGDEVVGVLGDEAVHPPEDTG